MKGEENEINVNHLGIFSKRCQTLRGGRKNKKIERRNCTVIERL